MGDAAIFFADQLSRERALTDDETARLCGHVSSRRRFWTAKEDRIVARMKATGARAPEIADRLGRTAWAVRFRLARQRAKVASRG
jgi:DNA-binding CsgD family transcriptional regulator